MFCAHPIETHFSMFRYFPDIPLDVRSYYKFKTFRINTQIRIGVRRIPKRCIIEWYVSNSNMLPPSPFPAIH